jgi:outer membrane protein TolC
MHRGIFFALVLFALAGPALAEGTPAPPAGTAGPVRTLSVKEAIVRALANNPDLEVARLDIAIASAGIDVAEGVFDPTLFAGVSWARNRDPFFAIALPGTDVGITGLRGGFGGLGVSPSDVWKYDGGLRQLTPFGTSWQASYAVERRTSESVFSLDPQWTPALSGSVTQPLLRGFGVAVNRAQVTIAREAARVSREAFLDLAMATAFAVEQAYWAYVFAVENRKVAEQALRTAEDLLDVNRKKLELGRVAPIEVLVAETGVASRQEAVIIAKNQIANTRDALLRLIEPPGSQARWDVEIVPLDAPRIEEKPVDARAAIETAMLRRPDLRRIEHSLAAGAARLEKAENDELPKLDLIGTWTELGLGDTHHNSHEAMLSGRFYEGSVGFGFEFPIFNTAARAAADQARLAIRQEKKRRESLEQTIVLDVRTAARDIDASRERVRAADKAAELAARQLEEQKKRLEVGLATNHDLLLFEQDLTEARTNAIKARIDYEVARARLARVTATILERRDIHAE